MDCDAHRDEFIGQFFRDREVLRYTDEDFVDPAVADEVEHIVVCAEDRYIAKALEGSHLVHDMDADDLEVVELGQAEVLDDAVDHARRTDDNDRPVAFRDLVRLVEEILVPDAGEVRQDEVDGDHRDVDLPGEESGIVQEEQHGKVDEDHADDVLEGRHEFEVITPFQDVFECLEEKDHQELGNEQGQRHDTVHVRRVDQCPLEDGIGRHQAQLHDDEVEQHKVPVLQPGKDRFFIHQDSSGNVSGKYNH